MTQLRVAIIGGFLSYRALFSWLDPTLFVLVLLVPSVTQIVFFAFLGRAANVADDAFFVIGNAVAAAAVPCLFAMAQSIADERYTQTLPMLIISPANRVALFIGRSAPAVVNGVVVAGFAFLAGALILGISVPLAAVAPLAATVAVAAFACSGLGLFNAALALRWRETAMLTNFVLYFLLLFAGVNIPIDRLPRWLSMPAEALPLRHAVEAARALVAGSTLSEVSGLLFVELAVGAIYSVLGLVLLRRFEVAVRHGARLELT